MWRIIFELTYQNEGRLEVTGSQVHCKTGNLYILNAVRCPYVCTYVRNGGLSSE